MGRFKEIVKSHGVEASEIIIREMINDEEKGLSLEDVSLKELYEGFCGENLNIHQRSQGFIETKDKDLKEAYVKSSAFTNITGELISKMIINAYKSLSKIGDKLTSKYKTRLRYERLPGFIGSEAPQTVNEGDAYPESGISDKYTELGEAEKKGRIISLTEEAIYFDQTGILIERAKGIGEKCALDREKKILRAILGIDNAYFPSGVSTALYQATPYRVTSNALVDWTDIEKCELDGFSAMVDDSPNRDEIIVTPNVVLVPSALKRTAQRILNATEVTHGDFDDVDSVKTRGTNPVKNDYQIVSSVLIHALQVTAGTTPSIAKSNWWMGDFSKQFKWKEIFPLQTFRAIEDSNLKFERDVVSRFKVRYYGNPFVIDNKYVVKNMA